MASKYWVGGNGTWNTTAGSKWSLTSGGTAGASIPSPSDDVFFDVNSGSGTVTIATGAVAMNVDCTGFTGAWAGSGDMEIEENLTLDAGMTSTYDGQITFKGDPALAYIRTNGIQLGSVVISGVQLTSGFFLYDNLSLIGSFTLHKGGFGLNGNSVTADSFISTGSEDRLLIVPNNAFYLTTSWMIDPTNFILSTSGAWVVQIVSDPNATITFKGGGQTYHTVYLLQSAHVTVKDSNIFTNLLNTVTYPGTRGNIIEFDDDQEAGIFAFTGNSSGVIPSERALVRSTVRGAQRELTVTNQFQCNFADFQDISSPSGIDLSAITGGSGDCGNNFNFTFTTPATLYWVDDASDYSDLNHWATSSGGSGGGLRYPLPQDTAIFDSNSFTTSGQTVTIDLARVGTIDCTGVTNTPTLNKTALNVTTYGSLTLDSGMTFAGTGPLSWGGVGANTFTRAGRNLTNMFFILDGTGSVTIDADLPIASIIGINGDFDAANFDVTIGGILDYSDTTGTKTLTMGSGTWEFTAGGQIVDIDLTGLTLNPDTSTILVSATGVSDKNFDGGGATFNDLRVNGAASMGPVILAGANTFNDITLDPNASIEFPSGQTTTVATFAATGTGGNTISIASSIPSVAATLSCPSGTINCDYIVLQDSAATGGATFHAGANSTDVSGNSGWLFP